MQKNLEIYLYSYGNFWFVAKGAGADGFFNNITDRSLLTDWIGQQEGRRIVLVNDDPEELEIMKERLEGSEVYTFEDSLEALKQIPEINPDVVLSDVLMPKMSGIQLVRSLREIFPKPF